MSTGMPAITMSSALLITKIGRSACAHAKVLPSTTSPALPDKGTTRMNMEDVRRQAFAMPLTNPSYPKGPYRFINREFLIITYRTDPDLLRAVIPAPLEFTAPLVKYEFIRMPDSTGFGD